MEKRLVRGLRALGALALLGSPDAMAASPASLDGVSLPTPTSPTRFAALESAVALGSRTLSTGARLTYLRLPLELRTPAGGAEGTNAPALSNVLAADVLLAGGFGRSFDVGAGLPMRIFQEGGGLEAIGQSPRVPSPALADPRLFAAWAFTPGGEWRLRPYVAMFLPLGTRGAFAGGASPRGVFGASSSFGERSLLTVDASLTMGETVTIGLTQWGSLAKLGIGYSATLFEGTSVSLESVFVVPLIPQLAPPGGDGPFLLATEILASVHHRIEAHLVGLILGAGLPTSRTSSLSDHEFTRAPTTPIVRLAVEYRFAQTSERSSSGAFAF